MFGFSEYREHLSMIELMRFCVFVLLLFLTFEQQYNIQLLCRSNEFNQPVHCNASAIQICICMRSVIEYVKNIVR